MKTITAAQARDMNPANAAEVHLQELFSRIEEAAKSGKSSIRLPYDLTEIRGEGSVAPKGAVGSAVVKSLTELGYQIKDHWDCGQFVDAYLTIEWGAA